MCGTVCCNEHFPEWKKESTYVWLGVKFLLIIIVAVVMAIFHDVEYVFFGIRFLNWYFIAQVAIFMIFVGFLFVIYAPHQRKLFPIWFIILFVVLYFGSFIFFVYEFNIADKEDRFLDPDKFRSNDNSFDLWTINHAIVGGVFALMLPFAWTLIVVIGWEVLELMVYVEDEIWGNIILDIIVALIVWWVVILIFARKNIPWISAKSAIDAKEAREANKEALEATSTNYLYDV